MYESQYDRREQFFVQKKKIGNDLKLGSNWLNFYEKSQHNRY